MIHQLHRIMAIRVSRNQPLRRHFSVLLDTVSSTLVPKSDTQASHTQAAIESLVSYVTDRMRMDMSRMIRGKFNTFLLLSFYEDLGPYLRKELDAYLESLDG